MNSTELDGALQGLERHSVGDLRMNLAEVLNRVAYGLSRVVVVRHGKPIAGVVDIESLALLERIADAAAIEGLEELARGPARDRETVGHDVAVADTERGEERPAQEGEEERESRHPPPGAEPANEGPTSEEGARELTGRPASGGGRGGSTWPWPWLSLGASAV